MKTIEEKIKPDIFPTDINGVRVNIGDKVRGFGYISFQDGWQIDRTPIVTANIQNGHLMFGGLSCESFDRFEIIGNIHDKHKQKQALIDMMRGDEELGLYEDTPKINDMSIVAEQIEKAQDALSALCKNPSSFTMRVPADEERDTDLIIAKALRYANQMRIALDKIANSPTPYNERELQSWYETARQISIKALSGQSDVEGS